MVSWVRRSGRKVPSGEKSHEVTMTCEAPSVSHSEAFSRVMPPPICMPSGQAARALRAACLFP